MRTLYRHPLSGHSHRAELLLSLLGLPHTLRDVDLRAGAHKTPAFLAMNPLGQVPVLDDDGVFVADSNAILVYLALRYDSARTWLPDDAVVQARVQRWLSVAAGPLAYGPAAARRAKVFGIPLDVAPLVASSHQLFTLIDSVVAPWLVGERPTIADLAMYTYVAHAPEGGVSLDDHPKVRAWLARVEALSGFVPMKGTAVGLAG